MDKKSKIILKKLYESYLEDANMAVSSQNLIDMDSNALTIKINELKSGRYLITDGATFDGDEIKITPKGIRLVKSWE